MSSTGTVKWFSDVNGFGFITPDNGGEDLFADRTAIRTEGHRSLREDEKVAFEVTQGNSEKWSAAVNIRPLA